MSLADLRAQPKKAPTRTVRLCLDLEALAEVQQLSSERDDLLMERATLAPKKGDDDKPRRAALPARVGEIDARVAEIEAATAGLFDTMRESEGDLLLRAVSGGEWQRFKDENPPREGSKTDEELTYALCDSSALMAQLGKYTAAWDGEEFEATTWDDWFGARVAPADHAELCREVVQLHEVRVRVPKARSTGSSEAPKSGSD